MEDEEKKARRAVARSDWLIIAAILFILLTTIAMILYPGSNNWTNQATHYSFAQNFFSDLGATRTYNDAANTASNVLFILALVLVGSGIAIFSFNSLVIACVSGKMRRLARAAIPVAMISGLGFIGVAAAPWNLAYGAHVIFVQVAFGFLLIFVILFTILQFANGWSRFYEIANLVYLVLLAAYLVLLFFGPDIFTMAGLTMQAVGQKIIVYVSIVNIAMQAYGIRKHVLGPTAKEAV
jgi:hypothetical protein